MKFETLRLASSIRAKLFKNSKGEVVHPTGVDGWTPAEWLEAMVGEVGEYANFAKKYRRGDITEDYFLEQAKKELADVQIYLDLLAARLGIDLGQATIDKFNEVSDRVGVKVKIVGESVHVDNVPVS